MKQTYFKFTPWAGRQQSLPKLVSRRFGIGGHFTHAYKSDGDNPDEDLEAIKKEFKKFKDTVEGDVVTKANAAALDAVKAFAGKIEALEKLKGLPEGVTGDELLDIKKNLATMIADFDAFQLKVNDFKPEPAKKDFGTILKAAVEEKTDEFKKMAAGDRTQKSIILDLKAVGDISTANVTGSTVWGAQMRPGIIELPNRKVHMRQVLVGGSVGTGTDFYFMRENGRGEGSPAFVAEGASKAQVDVDLVESSVKIETLAAYAKVTKKAMNNIPGFVSFLQRKLVEKVMRVEDSATLYGNGTSPNLLGIIQEGNYMASTSNPANTLIEKLMDDISELEDTHERSATKILLRPKAYMSFFKNKATGSGEYDLPKNVTFVNGILYIGNVPVFGTTALNVNDYLVGDFDEGAQFLTQEDLRIEFFFEDADNVTKNKVTVRIEETVALPVYGDNYFISGSTLQD